MRSRPSHDDRVAEVTRRRLAALTAELGRTDPAEPSSAGADIEIPVDLPTDPAPRPRPISPSTGGGRHARRPIQPTGRFTGWVSDHTPAVLQGRAHLGSAQVGLVCLVVAVGLVVAAFWLVRAAGVTGGPGEVVAPRPVVPGAGTEAPTAATPGPDPATPTPAVSAPAAGGATGEPRGSGDEIVVDVAGKVRRPGIAVLPAGSRVVDAVRAAGGVRRGVPPGSVNMARLLTDGEQVLVGAETSGGSVAGAALSTPGAASSGALVNLNTADQVALESLPGVGPVTAAAILQWRTDHGGFTSVDELLEVSGIGEATLAEVAPHVTL